MKYSVAARGAPCTAPRGSVGAARALVTTANRGICWSPPAAAMPRFAMRPFELTAVAATGTLADPEPESVVSFAVQIEPAQGTPADVEYRWDTDTDILTASVRSKSVGEGLSGSVELMGGDGAWLNLDVTGGRIH